MAFPTDIDTFTTMNADLPYTLKTEGHNTRHNELNTAVASLEAKVGADSSAVTSSHDYKIAQLESNDTTQDTDIDNLQTYQQDGWIAAGETWTYASASTFTISGDKTAKYFKGDKIKIDQSGNKYFYILSVSYAAPNTTITIVANTSYSIANATIDSSFYSRGESPIGFPNWLSLTHCSVYASAAQSITTSAEVTLEFDSETYDYGGDYDTTTYTFTAPISGIYQISSQVAVSDAVDQDRLRGEIEVNGGGTGIIASASTLSFGSAQSLYTQIAKTTPLDAGDTVVGKAQMQGNDRLLFNEARSSYMDISLIAIK